MVETWPKIMTRTRLTYFIASIQHGGAEMGMVRLLNELDPEEFDITVITLFDFGRDLLSKIPDHVTTILFDILNPKSVRQAKAAWTTFQATDVLVCSLIYPTAIGTLLGTLRNIPRLITWQHSTAYRGIVPSLRKGLSCHAHHAADRVLVDSEAVREMLIQDCGMPATKIAVIPLAAVDMDQFAPPDRSSDQETNRPLRVATVGRLIPVKGHAELLACAERFGDRLEFHVIGDGPLRTELEDQAPNNVIFYETVDNDALPRLLADMDLYFQPSRHEGLCISVIEAMAMGLPIVASAVGGIPESVNHGENGYLADAKGVDEFYEYLDRLATDAEKRTQFGIRSRELAVDRFSAEVAAKKFVTQIENRH
jgi:glycosyltransferase involved in cell wall biosynthesis